MMLYRRRWLSCCCHHKGMEGRFGLASPGMLSILLLPHRRYFWGCRLFFFVCLHLLLLVGFGYFSCWRDEEREDDEGRRHLLLLLQQRILVVEGTIVLQLPLLILVSPRMAWAVSFLEGRMVVTFGLRSLQWFVLKLTALGMYHSNFHVDNVVGWQLMTWMAIGWWHYNNTDPIRIMNIMSILLGPSAGLDIYTFKSIASLLRHISFNVAKYCC